MKTSNNHGYSTVFSFLLKKKNHVLKLVEGVAKLEYSLCISVSLKLTGITFLFALFCLVSPVQAIDIPQDNSGSGCNLINTSLKNILEKSDFQKLALLFHIVENSDHLLDVFFCDSNVIKIIVGSGNDKQHFWHKIYISKDGHKWEKETRDLSGAPLKVGETEEKKWIVGKGLVFESSFSVLQQKGVKYVAIYMCTLNTLQNGTKEWKCGCTDLKCAENSSGKWSIRAFQLGDSDDSGDPPKGVIPPIGESSHGSGGTGASGELRTANGIQYRIFTAEEEAGAYPLLMIYSGTERGSGMASNISLLRENNIMKDFVVVVLDGVDYSGNGSAGATVLDAVRSQYNIDNDKTYLLGESAGTTAGLELGLRLRQSYFAAYWANDVNARQTPLLSATELGFEPYGNAGPGGHFDDANAIVNGMKAAGYRTPDAPYSGLGSGTHGSWDQIMAAFRWFKGKTRL